MNKWNKFYHMIKILLILLIGSSFPVFAQSGLEMSVSGFVRDINYNSPIPGVEIIIARFEQGKFTNIFTEISDKNGFFKLRYLQAGNYIFRVKSPEDMILGSTLEPKNFDKLEIKEGINVNLNVFLGDSELPSFEKSVSMDGSTIIVNILYDKNSYRQIEALKKEEKLDKEDISCYTSQGVFYCIDKLLLELEGLDAAGKDDQLVRKAIHCLEQVRNRTGDTYKEHSLNYQDSMKAVDYLGKVKSLNVSAQLLKAKHIMVIMWRLFCETIKNRIQLNQKVRGRMGRMGTGEERFLTVMEVK